jgi:hypothetical protein
MKLFTTLLCLFAMASSMSVFAAEVSISDADITGGNDYYWTNDNIYVLEDLVFVEDGARLFIEEGTIIWGKEGQEDNAKALVICRGAQIFAEGTPDRPIIFTAYGDDPYDLDDGFELTESGLWGGLIILGYGPNNNDASDGVKNIEGIIETEERGKYGAPVGQQVDDDNSGVIRFVSIRHGGTDIGDGNEINGLTMGAVGAGTTIEYVEVWYNADDGFEFFGGNVNTKYLVSAFNKDDSFDYDEGFDGKGQFWFSIQAETRGNMAGEHDGGNKPDDSEPYATPEIYNVTYIGSGAQSDNSKSGILHFRDNAGGEYKNSIFAYTKGKGLDIEDLEADDENSTVEDSRKRLEAGDLKLENNIWWAISTDGTCTLDEISPDVPDEEKDGKVIPGYSEQFVRDYLGNAANGNSIENPQLMSIGRNLTTPDGMLDPRPMMTSPAFTNDLADVPMDGFFLDAPYQGAFGPGDLWIDRWTFLSQSGVAVQLRKNEISLTDADINAGDIYVMTADNIYVLEDMVFVEDGAELWIEAGTVIQGKEGQEDNSKALVICQGAKIYAMGTPVQPIIFTAYGDDPYDLDDGFELTETGLWGGLLILGKGVNNNVSSDGVKNIEGIIETETRGRYGAKEGEWNAMDNSGILMFVSIRHGGTDIGDGNEINGLTMGAVGAGTTIRGVEVWYNSDDGFEFFGGNVNTKYLVSAFNKDDSFDYDEGFNGWGQFWFSIQNGARGNMGGEHDGGNKPDDSNPYAIPFISNATYIGAGVGSDNSKSKGLHLRDNAGGKYFNSIFTETTGKGLDIEDLEADDPQSEVQDSRKRMEAMDLQLQHNFWWSIGTEGASALDVISPDVPDEEVDGKVIPGYSQQFVRDYLSDAKNNNWIEDPMLMGISRELVAPDAMLDPRPEAGSAAFTNAKKRYDMMGFGNINYSGSATVVKNGFFEEVDFIGAFGEINWLSDWTFLSFAEVTSGKGGHSPMMYPEADIETSVEELEASLTSSMVAVPNPMVESTEIQFEVKTAGLVQINIYDLNGQTIVSNLVNKHLVQGNYKETWVANSELAAGMYIVEMIVNGHSQTLKVVKN